jgi:hypothetical protein
VIVAIGSTSRARHGALGARLTALLGACAVLVAVPACSSSGGGHPAKSSSAPASPAALADTLAKGVAGIKTAQVSVNASLSGEKISGAGPAQFSSGVISGLDLTGDVPAIGHVRLLLTGGKFYAQLPSSLNTSGKPWVLVTGSSNPILSQLFGVVTKIQSAASLNNLVTLVRAAKSVTTKGSEKIDGTSTTHYRFVVDAAKLPDSFPGRSDLAGTLKDKPTDLWLDGQGRPVQVTRGFVLLGSAVDVTIKAQDFDKPVTITAPPAGDVAGG